MEQQVLRERNGGTSATRANGPSGIIPFAKTPDVPRIASRSNGTGRDRTIFEEDWWLTAATGGKIERAEVRWDNVVVGSLDYYATKEMQMRKIVLPPYTRILAP